MFNTAGRVILFCLVAACVNAADLLPSTPMSVGDEEALPILPERVVSPWTIESQLASVRRTQMMAGCKVAPLSDIEDPEALAFERDAESANADVDGLMPPMAQALESFKDLVTSVGGTFDLKSAYRPSTYQAHLHEVWVKWVKELRNNRSAACRALREEVSAEFARHQLLVRQQPVPASDHSLGLAFDAAVAMPRAARLNRKRVTVDKLALLAGIKRPNSRRDPVHFKLLLEHAGI